MNRHVITQIIKGGKMLPCPFCDSEAELTRTEYSGDHYGTEYCIGCSNKKCIVFVPDSLEGMDRQNLIKKWNNRLNNVQKE